MIPLLLTLMFAPSPQEVAESWMNSCRNLSRDADPFLVLDLVDVEELAGVPPELSGLLAATWCREANMAPYPPDGDGGLAQGAFQLHPWAHASSTCGLASGWRTDLVASALCYWHRIEVRALVSECPEPWRVAEAMVANGNRYKHWGCSARSQHWKEWQSWKR